MRPVVRLAASLLALAALAASVNGADARRPLKPFPEPSDRPPHGIYECWPDAEPAGPVA
jgi:hypothetical protein